MANKITAVQNNGTYQGQYGLMYKQEVTLDDGTTGEVSAKTADKWKVGNVVEVQRTETQHGTRFRFSIPQEVAPGATRPASGGRSSDPETTLRIEASWAIAQAVAIGHESHTDLVRVGLILVDARNALIKALKQAQVANEGITQASAEPWEESAGDVPNQF